MIGALHLVPINVFGSIHTLGGKTEFTHNEVKRYIAVEVLILMASFTGYFDGNKQGKV